METLNDNAREGLPTELDRFSALFEQAPICIHEIDIEGCLVKMNAAGLDLLCARSEDEVRGRAYLDFVTPEDKGRIGHLLQQAIEGKAAQFEFSSNDTAHPRHFTSCFIPCPDADGKICRLIGITADITQRKEAETELRRLNRIYAVLSRCNNSLARAANEQHLLNAFCKILVDVGGYAFAWIGYVKRNPDLRLCMMASAGHGDAGLSAAVKTWANAVDKPSPCRTAVLTGKPVVYRDIESEPGMPHWRETAMRLGFRSSIALPLQASGNAIGNFSIFSATFVKIVAAISKPLSL